MIKQRPCSNLEYCNPFTLFIHFVTRSTALIVGCSDSTGFVAAMKKFPELVGIDPTLLEPFDRIQLLRYSAHGG